MRKFTCIGADGMNKAIGKMNGCRLCALRTKTLYECIYSVRSEACRQWYDRRVHHFETVHPETFFAVEMHMVFAMGTVGAGVLADRETGYASDVHDLVHHSGLFKIAEYPV